MAAESTPASRAESTHRQTQDFDPAIFWRWLATQAQPIAGWVMVAVGALLLVLGYLGVSREALVARQLPYLVSGGLGGVSLLFLGGAWLGLNDIRKLNRRLDHVERLASELHGVLLTAVDVASPAEDTEQLEQSFVKLPTGQSYHAPGCAVVAGKAVEPVTLPGAAEQGLTPCKLCEPAPSA